MTLQELVVKISADTKEFNAKIENARKKLNSAAKGMAIAGGVIAGGLALAIKNAAGEEEAQAQLTAALKSTKQYTEQLRKSLSDYATQLQNTTGVGDEAIQKAMAFGLQMGLSAKQVKALIPHILDLNAATGVDLQTAMRAAAQAAHGQVGMLQRYGVQVKKAKDGTVNFNDLLNSFSGYAGAAKAKGETFAGQLEIMKAEFSDLTKEIGFVLIPILKEFLNKYIKPLIKRFQDLPKPVKENIAKFGGLIAITLLAGAAIAKLTSSILGIVGAVKATMKALTGLVSTNPMLLLIMGIIAAVVLLYEAWTHDWGGIREKTEAVWRKVRPIFEGIKKVFLVIIGLVKDYIDIYIYMWRKVQPIFHKLGRAFEWIGDVVRRVFSGIKDWFDKLKGWIDDTIGKFSKLIEKIKKVFHHGKGGETPGEVATGKNTAIGTDMEIPHFATGGAVFGPTLALIGERASKSNPEYVIPANAMQQTSSSATERLLREVLHELRKLNQQTAPEMSRSIAFAVNGIGGALK